MSSRAHAGQGYWIVGRYWKPFFPLRIEVDRTLIRDPLLNVEHSKCQSGREEGIVNNFQGWVIVLLAAQSVFAFRRSEFFRLIGA